MSHTFSVNLPEGMDLKTGVERVRAGVTGAGGTYAFDGKNGSFALKGVHGTFSVAGLVVTITLLKKPFLVTWGYIESTVRGYFKKA